MQAKRRGSAPGVHILEAGRGAGGAKPDGGWPRELQERRRNSGSGDTGGSLKGRSCSPAPRDAEDSNDRGSKTESGPRNSSSARRLTSHPNSRWANLGAHSTNLGRIKPIWGRGRSMFGRFGKIRREFDQVSPNLLARSGASSADAQEQLSAGLISSSRADSNFDPHKFESASPGARLHMGLCLQRLRSEILPVLF